MDDQLPLVLFLDDLAEQVLRCSRKTAERLRKAGQLPTELPIDGRPRWSRDVVLDWLSSGATTSRRGRRR